MELNWTTQKIGEIVHTQPGMKMVGFGNMLVEFPSTFQTMYFIPEARNRCKGMEDTADCPEVVRQPVKARSSDGLEMTISISFQWKLLPKSLKPLYEILGADLYKDEFVRFARSSIVESCSKFAADRYFTNRTEITAVMLERLTYNFRQAERDLAVEIKDVQLREVDLPDEFDEEIANTQEQMQEIEIAEAERDEQKISMEREMLVATEKVLQVAEEARGQAEKVRVENTAVVENMRNYRWRQALANGRILQRFENSTEPFQRLFEMMKIRALGDHNDSSLLINL